MAKFIPILVYAAFAFAASLATSPAHAQALRTWVSSAGDDINPCSRTAPCKTFPGAISKTAAGGEIDALDPAGYNAVTITKAITIDGGGGQVASVLVAGTNGIIINAGANDTVILRNLRINGTGTGLNGIRFIAGLALIVENVEIVGFTQNGIDVQNGGGSPRVAIIDTNILNNGGNAINFRPGPGGNVNALVSRVRAVKNNNGVVADASGTFGAVHVSVESSEASTNSGAGFLATTVAGQGTSRLMIARSTSTANNIGVSTVGASATAIVGNSTLFLNTVGFSAGGQLLSYKNNSVFNVSDGTATPINPQ